jgi:hypothetical protein
MATSAVTRLTRNSIEARELKAIELRNSGKTILQIANETNLSTGSVRTLLKRVKRNNNIWCPKKNGRPPLMSPVALEERELQVDRLCMKNGGCIEHEELQSLVKNMLHLESQEETKTCEPLTRAEHDEYDNLLHSMPEPDNASGSSKSIKKYMHLLAPVVQSQVSWADRRRNEALMDPMSHFTFATVAAVATGNEESDRMSRPVYPGLYVNIDSTQKLISHNAKKNIKGRSTKKTKQYFQRRNQSLKALGEGSKRNDIWSRITLHAVVFADSKWVTPLYVYKAKGKDKIETLQLYRIRCDNSSSMGGDHDAFLALVPFGMKGSELLLQKMLYSQIVAPAMDDARKRIREGQFYTYNTCSAYY